jgi:hypothetical protein
MEYVWKYDYSTDEFIWGWFTEFNGGFWWPV